MTFADRYGPWAVVLGASEGLGEAFADAVAARGVNVVLVARRVEPLGRVAEDIGQRHGVEARPVVIDPAIDTPTFRASMPPEAVAAMPPAMSPDDVAEEVLDALGSTPSFVPGASNREGIGILGSLPRQKQVEAMAKAHAAFAKHQT